MHNLSVSFTKSNLLMATIMFAWITVLFALSYLSHVQSECCPDGWVKEQDSCYLFSHSAPVHFTEAEHYCIEHGGHLVQIDSEDEMKFLASFLVPYKTNFWCGATDDMIEGVWQWEGSNDCVSYFNWSPGQPDNRPLEDCMVLLSTERYQYHDDMCTSQNTPLCEINRTLETEIVG